MPDANRQPFVLASASPRRRELLSAAGYAFSIDVPDIDERRHGHEAAEAYVGRVALEKAQAVAVRHPGRVVLAADTAVVVDHEIFGKPRDARDAARMLRALSDRAHDVLTAVALVRDRHVESAVDRTTVTMRAIGSEEMDAYVASGEPLDKAGAYAIQGGAGAFVLKIDGALDTVIGLPMATVTRLLANADRAAAVTR